MGRTSRFTVHMANKTRSPGRRSQAESTRTRRRILDRAERLFARKGYRGASLREIALASQVRPFTIQHHFGSKVGLYRAVLGRWDSEVLGRVDEAIRGHRDPGAAVEAVVDSLFDLFLARRNWVAITARAALGEGLPRGVTLGDRSWVQFIDRTTRDQRFGTLKLDLGLLLITVEGILNNHVLARAHYRQLYGKDVTDPLLKRRTKEHLKAVILALMGAQR